MHQRIEAIENIAEQVGGGKCREANHKGAEKSARQKAIDGRRQARTKGHAACLDRSKRSIRSQTISPGPRPSFPRSSAERTNSHIASAANTRSGIDIAMNGFRTPRSANVCPARSSM